MAGSTAASWSIRARAASPPSRSDGIAVSGLGTAGAAPMTGGGIAGAAGTDHVSSSVRGKAITAGAGIGEGAVSPGRSARKGVCAGAAPVAAPVLGLASTVGLACGTIAASVRHGGGAGDTDGVGAGPLAAGCSTDACCDGSTTDVTAGSAAVTCAGTSTTRRSGTSIRRSCQGKPKPGSQPWPPKVRLNSSAWISSESSSACVNRLRSRLALAVGAALEPVELKRAPPSLLGRCCRRASGWRHFLCACRLDRPTGHDPAKGPRRHS